MAEQNPFDEVFGGVSFTSSVSAAQLRRAAERRRVRRRWAVAGVVTAAALVLSAGGVVAAHRLADRDRHGDPSPWATASPTQAVPELTATATASANPAPTPTPTPTTTTPRVETPAPQSSTSAPTGPPTIHPASGMMAPILPDPTELGWPMADLETMTLELIGNESSWPGCDAVARKLSGQPTLWWGPPGNPALANASSSTRGATTAVSTPNGPALAKSLIADIRACTGNSMQAPSDVLRTEVVGFPVDRWTRRGVTPDKQPVLEMWAAVHSDDAVVISYLNWVQNGKMTRAEADAGMTRHVEAAARNLANPRFDIPTTPGEFSIGTMPGPDDLPGGSERWSAWWVGPGAPQAVLGECDAAQLLDRGDSTFFFASLYTDHTRGRGWVELYGSTPDAPELNWKTITDNAQDCKRGLLPKATVKVVSLTDHTFSGRPAWVGVYDVTTEDGNRMREVWGAVKLGDRIVVALASQQVSDGAEQVRTALAAVAANDTP